MIKALQIYFPKPKGQLSCGLVCKHLGFEANHCSNDDPEVMALMKIKDFSQCIDANKQQWCGLVAAASCGIVAACEFFVCKLVLLLLVAATLRLLVAGTLQLLVAATLRLLVAATLQLFVCRECVGLVVDCF